MTREEAAREIDNTACCFSDKRFRDAMHMAIAALRGPQPDPEPLDIVQTLRDADELEEE